MAEEQPRVLVVDGERFYREAVCETLDTASIGCATAESGEAALAAVADAPFGVVVLDLAISDMPALDLLRRIRETAPSIRVIVLAVQADQDAVLEALRLGASDYLAKPLHDEELLLAVQRALGVHALETEADSLRRRICVLAEKLSELDRDARACEVGERAAQVAPRVAEIIASVLAAEKASMLVVDDDGGLLRVAGSVGHPVPVESMDSVAPGERIAGTAFSERESLLVSDLDADDRFSFRDTRARYRTKSLLVTPIAGADAPLGVLCATDRTDGRRFAAVDLALLRIIAARIASWLEAAPESAQPEPIREREPASRAHEEADRRPAYDAADGVEDSELARRICDVLTYEIDPERVISGVLGAIARMLPASPVSLYLIENRSGELELEGQVMSDGPADRERLERSTGLTGMVLQTGNPVATDHPDKDPRFVPEADTPEDGSIRPLICVPIRMRGKSLGVLRVFPLAGGAASPRTAEILATATSAAVRNVLLYRSLLEAIDEVARVRREARH